MRDIVRNALHDAANFLTKECLEINVRHDEFYPFNLLVKARSLTGEYTSTAPRFIIGEREKADKKRKCDENKDEMPHSN